MNLVILLVPVLLQTFDTAYAALATKCKCAGKSNLYGHGFDCRYYKNAYADDEYNGMWCYASIEECSDARANPDPGMPGFGASKIPCASHNFELQQCCGMYYNSFQLAEIPDDWVSIWNETDCGSHVGVNGANCKDYCRGHHHCQHYNSNSSFGLCSNKGYRIIGVDKEHYKDYLMALEDLASSGGGGGQMESEAISSGISSGILFLPSKSMRYAPQTEIFLKVVNGNQAIQDTGLLSGWCQRRIHGDNTSI